MKEYIPERDYLPLAGSEGVVINNTADHLQVRFDTPYNNDPEKKERLFFPIFSETQRCDSISNLEIVPPLKVYITLLHRNEKGLLESITIEGYLISQEGETSIEDILFRAEVAINRTSSCKNEIIYLS